jgi:hypothetical protein
MTTPYEDEMRRLKAYYGSYRAPTEAEVQAMTFPQLLQARKDLQDVRKYGGNIDYHNACVYNRQCPDKISANYQDVLDTLWQSEVTKQYLNVATTLDCRVYNLKKEFDDKRAEILAIPKADYEKKIDWNELKKLLHTERLVRSYCETAQNKGLDPDSELTLIFRRLQIITRSKIVKRGNITLTASQVKNITMYWQNQWKKNTNDTVASEWTLHFMNEYCKILQKDSTKMTKQQLESMIKYWQIQLNKNNKNEVAKTWTLYFGHEHDKLALEYWTCQFNQDQSNRAAYLMMKIYADHVKTPGPSRVSPPEPALLVDGPTPPGPRRDMK